MRSTRLLQWLLVFSLVAASGCGLDSADSGDDPAVSLAGRSLASGGIELLGTALIPGSASDGTSPLPAVLEDGTPHDRLGGLGSAIAYTGLGTRYVATPDRGPADGTTSYLDRYYLLDVAAAPGSVSATLLETHFLTDESGQGQTGSSAAFDPTNSPASLRFDPEGVRVGPRGTLFVSDEYGPFLYEYAAGGSRLRSVSLPPSFLIANPSATGVAELPPGNTSGR